MHASMSVILSGLSTLHSGSIPTEAIYWMHKPRTFDLHEIIKYTPLEFTVYGCKQQPYTHVYNTALLVWDLLKLGPIYFCQDFPIIAVMLWCHDIACKSIPGSPPYLYRGEEIAWKRGYVITTITNLLYLFFPSQTTVTLNGVYSLMEWLFGNSLLCWSMLSHKPCSWPIFVGKVSNSSRNCHNQHFNDGDGETLKKGGNLPQSV